MSKSSDLVKTVPIIINRQSIGFCGLLFIILLLLKAGVVETAAMGWSWWWITAPLWGPIALVFGLIAIFVICFLLVMFLCLIIVAITSYFSRRKRRKVKKNG